MRAALLGAALVVAVGAVPAATLSDPIVGTWSRSPSGSIKVAAIGGGFRGDIAVPYTAANGCVHKVGQHVWEIGPGTARVYTGLTHGFRSAPPACVDQPQQTTWRLLSGIKLESCISGYGCSVWYRPSAPRTTHAAYRFGLSVAAKAVRATGAGRFELGPNKAAGSLLLVHEFTGRPDAQTSLAVTGVATGKSQADRVALAVKVVYSTLPRCRAGAVGRVELVDGSPDSARFQVCGRRVRFVGARDRVSVSIRRL